MFKNILLPIDLDVETSWKSTIPLAEGFARDWGAEIHALTVVPNYGMSMVGSYFPKGFEDEALERASERLKTVLAETASGPEKITPHVALGNIYEEILESAKVLGSDLIVMTSHRPELKDYLIGPNAARVMRHATQSVFVVRS